MPPCETDETVHGQSKLETFERCMLTCNLWLKLDGVCKTARAVGAAGIFWGILSCCCARGMWAGLSRSGGGRLQSAAGIGNRQPHFRLQLQDLLLRAGTLAAVSILGLNFGNGTRAGTVCKHEKRELSVVLAGRTLRWTQRCRKSWRLRGLLPRCFVSEMLAKSSSKHQTCQEMKAPLLR